MVNGRPAELVFADEFTALNANSEGRFWGWAVWQTRYFYGARTLASNHEAQYFSDTTTGTNPFVVADSVLTITAKPAQGLPDGATYISGMLTTYQSFRPTYGYFEVRARLPTQPGMWPAAWLLPADGSWPPEIDMFEVIGSHPQTVFLTVHSASSGTHIQEQAAIPKADLDQGFHTFAVSWRRTSIDWYLDDQPVYSRPTPPDLHRPMYLLLALAVGGIGSWPGPAVGETASLDVDYVRAYRYDDGGG